MQPTKVIPYRVKMERFINNLCPSCEYFSEGNQCKVPVQVIETEKHIELRQSCAELDMEKPIKKKKECKRQQYKVEFKSFVTS